MDAVYAILICDDDDDTRAAMRRALRGHHVIEAASPTEGLAALRAASFDAVVSDFHFGPGEGDGLDFLQTVCLQWPPTVRLLVTGSTDLDVAIRAVNGGAVHRYIKKPWRPDQLRMTVEIALRGRMDAGDDPAGGAR
jgi:DNA-binding NtrC family response regulator